MNFPEYRMSRIDFACQVSTVQSNRLWINKLVLSESSVAATGVNMGGSALVVLFGSWDTPVSIVFLLL